MFCINRRCGRARAASVSALEDTARREFASMLVLLDEVRAYVVSMCTCNTGFHCGGTEEEVDVSVRARCRPVRSARGRALPTVGAVSQTGGVRRTKAGRVAYSAIRT